jgi:hypothetical protein
MMCIKKAFDLPTKEQRYRAAILASVMCDVRYLGKKDNRDKQRWKKIFEEKRNFANLAKLLLFFSVKIRRASFSLQQL